MTAARRLVRLFAVTYWLHLKMMATSAFDGVFQVVWPLFFATTAFLVYRQSANPHALVYAGLGSAMMGVWSVIATTASNLLQRERWFGTLELLVAAPTRFALVLVPITTAMASLGVYSLVATLLWAWLLFGVTVPVVHPVLFGVAVIAAIFSIALIGFLLSVVVVRYRTAWALGNLLEYPGWLVCGFLVPLTLFPGWAGWIADALPPTWGMRAIRSAAAGVQSDEFFLIGNAVQYAAIPCLFGMGQSIEGERWTQTLGIVLATPARRLPLFLGRALPVVVNGFLVALFSVAVGSLLLGVSVPGSAWLPLVVVLVVASASCTGLGLVTAAIGLRVRETAVLLNVLFGIMLVFCGANVPLSRLPGWMATVGAGLPLTHAIAAARQVASGSSLGSVGGLIGHEALVGVVYGVAGLAALRLFEAESRRRATLEIQ